MRTAKPAGYESSGTRATETAPRSETGPSGGPCVWCHASSPLSRVGGPAMCSFMVPITRVCVSTDPSSAAIEVKSERESIVSPLKMTETSIIPAMSGCFSPSSIAAIDSFFMIAPCDPGLIGTIVTRDTGVATGAAGPLKCQSTVPMLIDGGPAKCSAMPPITFFVASALFLSDSIVEKTERATILSSSVKK